MYQVFQVKPVFIYDVEGTYCNNSMWIVPNASLTLLGILNSKLGWWQISMNCTEIQNGYQLIFKYLERIRILGENANVDTWVRQILAQKQSDPAADTTTLEDKIDLLLYQHYGLSYAEVLLVDEEFELSEKEYATLLSPS